MVKLRVNLPLQGIWINLLKFICLRMCIGGDLVETIVLIRWQVHLVREFVELVR